MASSNQKTTPGQVTIEVIGAGQEGGEWIPVVGPETEALIGHFNLPDDKSRATVRDQAINVLRKCVPPTANDGTQTGLVVGYVQSGKTMSFTTVAALARDNGYEMIVVIAGVSTPLFNQSKQRLESDLRLMTRDDHKWKVLSNPKIDQKQTIESTLNEWKDPTVPLGERQTILMVVMKNHTHLRNLDQLLQSLKLDGSLDAVPTIVIDDEADQAGLNSAVRKGMESPTYSHLVALRDYLPHHTFLQYTATPQAPLLINLIDILSPRFVEVLTPGPAYTGGKLFFVDNPLLVRTIPQSDIPSPGNVLTQAPASLLQAMRLYYLGVAAGLATGETHGNRSMMVHPSQKRAGHAQYTHWVKQIRTNWLSIVRLDTSDPDRQQLLDEFAQAYDDLAKTAADLPPFSALALFLQRAINKANIIEVNSSSGKTPPVDWKGDYPHILVGGQSMDRGYTVEGLTVTYMPRGSGIGNADTIQQRARFFGYKAGYIGYCRVFLGADTLQAYEAYVQHEEDVHQRLQKHRQSGKPLSEWKRAFFLDGSLKPTRDCVLDLDYMKGGYSDDWYYPKAPYESQEAVANNSKTVSEFVSALSLKPDSGHPMRTEHMKHFVAENVPLADVLERLLLRYRVTRFEDSQHLTGVMLQVKKYLDHHGDAICNVYQMSKGMERSRSVYPGGEIMNLFQGAHPDKNGQIYPGDRRIHSKSGLTVQLHNLKIEGSPQGDVPGVPLIAIWVPNSMAGEWLSQAQGNAL